MSGLCVSTALGAHVFKDTRVYLHMEWLSLWIWWHQLCTHRHREQTLCVGGTAGRAGEQHLTAGKQGAKPHLSIGLAMNLSPVSTTCASSQAGEDGLCVWSHFVCWVSRLVISFNLLVAFKGYSGCCITMWRDTCIFIYILNYASRRLEFKCF